MGYSKVTSIIIYNLAARLFYVATAIGSLFFISFILKARGEQSVFALQDVRDETSPVLTQEAIHTRLWFCRKLYIIVSTMILMVVGYQYQDYNKINFDMLHNMQLQIMEMKRWQEKINSLKAITNGESPHQSSPGASLSQQSITHPRYSNHDKPCDVPDSSMGNNSQNLDDDDEDDESDHSYVPSESELESFSEESSEEEEDEEEQHNKDDGQKIKPDFTTLVTGKKSKGTPQGTPTKTTAASSRRTKSREKVPNSTPSYRYNLRSRNNTPSDIHNSFFSGMPSPSKLTEFIKTVQQSSARRYTAVIRTPRNNNTDNTPLFSSDEEC